MRNCWISRAISAMRGINRRVRGIKEEAKGVANRAAYHVASAMEATFPVRRRVGQRPPDHGKVASFSRVPGPSPGNSGHDPGQDRPNSAEILGIGAIAPLYTGVRVTQSALTQDAVRRVSGPLGGGYPALRDQFPTADVTYTDDTGWRVGGHPAQLMIFVTATATVFQVRAQHRNEEVREVIGDDYRGVLVTDRGKSYDAQELEQVKQQKCIPHALRSINEVLETKQGRARQFGGRLKKLLKEGLALWHEYHDHHSQLAGFERRVQSLRAEVTRHLRPRRLTDADNQRLLDEFGRHHAHGNLLRFLEDPRAQPTNNVSERGFRFAVIQRKVSQCSKTSGGARAFEAFASV